MARNKRQNRTQKKNLKRRNKLHTASQRQAQRRLIFLDGLDSYAAEYEKWKRTRIVESLLGVFELSDDLFYDATDADRLAHVGLEDHRAVLFESGYESAGAPCDKDAKASGFASSVVDQSGTIRPVIFIRARIDVDDLGDNSSDDAKTRDEVTHAIRLLVFLHELGHAEDIAKGVNFCFADRTLDLVRAEVYADVFACGQAKRCNYRLALGHYLDHIEGRLQSEIDYVRAAADLFHQEIDVPGMKAWASMPWSESKGFEHELARQRFARRPQ